MIRVNAKNAHMESARAIEVRLEDTTFAGADLKAATFLQSRGSIVDFSHCILEGSDFRSVRFRNVKFIGARLVGSKLTDAKFENADWSRADVSFSLFARTSTPRACFGGAILHGCDFRDADLAGCDFRGADLSECRLQGASIQGADFREANLLNARGLTSQQLFGTRTDAKTTLPAGKKGPYPRNSGYERPMRISDPA
jgi:uncharacterized protein YjbI with pentapeptide repeats